MYGQAYVIFEDLICEFEGSRSKFECLSIGLVSPWSIFNGDDYSDGNNVQYWLIFEAIA